MRETFLKIRNYYAKVILGFALLAGACTFAIMWVIDSNALLRKTFNTPVPAALEMTQSLLVVAIMLPFAYTLLKREHVNTVFLTSHLSASTRRWLYVFWMAVGFILFSAVTYGAFQYGLRSYRMNEQIWGATIQFPLWPSKMAVCVGTALISIQFLLDCIASLLIPDFHDQPADQTEGYVDV